MLPNRMKDLDATAYYARYIEVEKGLPGRPRVYACPPKDLSRLLTCLKLGPDKRLIRGRDDTPPDMALVAGNLLVKVG